MKRRVLFMVIASLAVMCATALAASAKSGPKLAFVPATRSLGNVPQEGVRKFVFEVVNRGDSDLVIDKVQGSCGCTEAAAAQKVVKPKGRTKVMVTFTADKTLGPVTKSVVISSNDPANRIQEFSFTVNVVGKK